MLLIKRICYVTLRDYGLERATVLTTAYRTSGQGNLSQGRIAAVGDRSKTETLPGGQQEAGENMHEELEMGKILPLHSCL